MTKKKSQKKGTYYIDVPFLRNPKGPWVCLATFENKKDALKYAMNVLGADKNGKINVINFCED